jgi:modulator of FtsH protease
MRAPAATLSELPPERGAIVSTTSTTAGPAPLSRDESGALLGQTLGLVALTAGFFTLGAYLGRNISGGWGIVSFIAAFATLLALNVAAQRSEQLAIGLLFAFGVLLGVGVAPTIADYASADPNAVWEAGGATALFIAGVGAAGYATRRDLAPIARYSYWALLALIVFGIVLVFVQIPGGSLIYAIAGLVIFAGLTLFDFQRLRQTQDLRTAPLLAASIFLDVLNVFLLFLTIFGNDE